MTHRRHLARYVLITTAATVLPAGAIQAQAPRFRDVTAELGIKLSNSPASWGDVNNDGWVDLYNAGTVWLNNSGTGFTALSARGSGLIVDIDNDGLGDLVSYAPLAVLRNIDNERFEALPLPELPETSSRGAACGDFNGDGFIDIYIGGFEVWDKQITYPDLLLINEGGKTFRLALQFGAYRARGVTACDFDEDADLDIYVSNYRLLPNVLWLNNGQAEFERGAAARNAIATSPNFGGGHSIGAAWGDFDNDGRIDLFAGNFAHVDNRGDQPKSRFLRNLGPDKGFVFDDLGPCGVYYQESYASPAAADFDNDGDLDLYFTTVYADASFGRKNYPVLYRNEGEWSFADLTSEAGLAELPPTYQAAWADYDRDGDLDLVTAGRLYVNDGPKRHWIQVRLVGDGERIDSGAVGAQVRITLGSRTLTRQVEVGTGEGNANSPILHFGLGDHAGPVKLQISWPNGDKQTVPDAAPNQLHTIRFKAADEERPPAISMAGARRMWRC